MYDAHNDAETNSLLNDLGEGSREVSPARIAFAKALVLSAGVRIVLAVAATGMIWLAYQLPLGSHGQAVLSNLAPCVFAFLSATPLLKAVQRTLVLTLILGLLISGVAFCLASAAVGVLQSVLINFGAAVLLVVTLDILATTWLDLQRRSLGEASARLKEARALVEKAESGLDYAYAVHDHLGLPRPYRFGGVPLEPGTTFLGVLGYHSPEEAT